MSYRAVVIGCGNIGSRYDDDRPPGAAPLTHAGAYHAHPAYELVGAADVDGERLMACREKWGLPDADTDYTALLARAQPDIVSIATPPAVRLPAVKAAIESGARAVFCEKPLADSAAEGEAIMNACQAGGVLLAVNYIRRWEPAAEAVSSMLRAGELGAIQRITGAYVRGIRNNGGHLLDLLHWWVGQIGEVVWVMPRYEGSPDVRLQVGEGEVTVDLLALDADLYDVFEMDVFAEKGCIRVRDYGRQITVQRVHTQGQYRVLDDPQPLLGNLDGTLMAALADIDRCLRDGTAPACTGEDGLAVLRVLDQIEDRLAGLAS
jgi:predicted dehydrogenase